ncbi:MAG: beta-propeller fold lactonase family protein [Gemmatimonadales bacterium]
MQRRNGFIAVAALTFALAGCADTGSNAVPVEPNFSASGGGTAGTVYTMSNAVAGNEVLIFSRRADGALEAAGSAATGGTGTGSGLGNQGGLVLTDDGRWLLAVNAGSNSIAVFRVLGQGGLRAAGTVASGGVRPISVTVSGSLVYALNAGGSGNITGFRLSNDGALTMIAGSTRPLSGAGSGPAQVAFDPSGRVLVVTEKAANSILTFLVGADGLTSAPRIQASNGDTPFGFAFSQTGVLIVSEAFGGAANAGAASSYQVSSGGELSLVSGSVVSAQSAPCWFVITGNSRFAYTSNTQSGTITGYSVSGGGLSLLNADGVTGRSGAGPIDLAISRNSKFLYSLDSGTETITAFAVGADGSLQKLGATPGIPDGANGLASR